MKYSNKDNIPLAAAVFLATDFYDHNPDPSVVSVTSLMRSTREVLLTKRLQDGGKVSDLRDMLASRLGTAFHAGVERAWLSPQLPETLANLGFADHIVDKVVINPPEPTGGLDVYLELRTNKKVGKWTVSGELDICIDGCITDLKSTGVYTYINQTNAAKYIEQMSIYRWLNPEIVLDDYGKILYLFKDWSKHKVGSKGYPNLPVMEQSFELLSLEETDKLVKHKLALLDKYKSAPDHDLPQCTKEELWQGPTKYAYFSKPTNTKASKIFTNAIEAQIHMQDKGVGTVKPRLATPTKCLYCSAVNSCSQAQNYISSGILEL
jgi:hypothetical protein